MVANGAGALSALVWIALGAPGAFTVERVVTVLVIACPPALGLAIPLVIAISTTLGARNGLLVRHRRGLEEARSLDAVVFDKTGTLTLGEFRVVEITTGAGEPPGTLKPTGAGSMTPSPAPLTETVALPLAAGVLARWGILLPVALGAVLMSLSTIIVALNAQLLRRVRL
jgi:Cu2+-exporting ATPase